MNTMIRLAFLTALLAMVASCEFYKENDLLEELKKDSPIGTGDTDTGDKDETPDLDNAATCGNSAVDGAEECDFSTGVTDQACDQLDGTQYSGGIAHCDPNCMWDRSNCVRKNCGDGTVQTETEECDTSLPTERNCIDIDPQKYKGGVATCGVVCKWDTSNCVPLSCGNGALEEHELCDNSSVEGGGVMQKPCSDIDDKYYAGPATCDNNCHWDLSECKTEGCGDGTVVDPEQCEGTEKEPCVNLGANYVSGQAECDPTNCMWMLSGCKEAVCGDDTVEGAEECEGDIEVDCSTVYADKIGLMACQPDQCTWDTSQCIDKGECGDNVVNGNELCEKNQGKLCVEIDANLYSDGSATCNDFCDGWLTGNCTLKSTCACGNGIVDHDPSRAGTCAGYNEACETGQTSTCNDQGDIGDYTQIPCKTDCTGWDTTLCGETDFDNIPDDYDEIPDEDTAQCANLHDGLCWSTRSAANNMTQYEAITYCEDLSEEGYSEWRLPTIAELRTLITNCPSTETGGTCGVGDTCVNDNCWAAPCDGCSPYGNTYSAFGEASGMLWSSSVHPDNTAFVWTVDFGNARVNNGVYRDGSNSPSGYVRCVKTPAVCGNGIQEGNEFCDDGASLNGTYGHCNADCDAMGPHCGDGTTDAGQEACDDSNTDPGDGCSSNCKFIDNNCAAITAGTFSSQMGTDGVKGDMAMFVTEFTPTEGSGSIPELLFFYIDTDFIPVKSQAYSITEAVKSDYGLQAMVDYDGASGTIGTAFAAYAGQMHFNDYDLDGNGKFTDSAWGQVDVVYFGEIDTQGKWVQNGQCRYLSQASWDLIDYPVITDLTASYSGVKDNIQIQWTAPQNASRYNQYRICVDSTCNDITAGMSPGGTEIQTVTVPWYSGSHQISVQPFRDGNVAAIAATIDVDTNGHAELAPSSGIDFGLVGYNSYLDRAVTINNTSTLVDLVINETTLPMDCTGKVTILSGNVTPASQMTVDPGAFHVATLRYAPTETSQCTDGQVRAQWVVTDDGLGNKTYEEANLPVSGSSANTPPVITATSASVNPAKNSNGTIRLFINVMDENTILLSEFDGIQGVGDFREVGGGPRESLGNTTYGTGDNHWYWWRDIDVSTLGNGIYVIPITVTDSAGHIAKTNATFAIYSGNILEVGDGKTFTAIKDAVNAAGNYDVIVVHPGTYTGTGNSNINPGSKTISIYGIDGPDNTIVDATDMLDPTFVVDQDNGNLYIGGLALLNNPGGAVWLGAATNNQKVTLTDFRIEGNSNSINGGALTAANDKVDLTITHGVFHNNSATGAAGGAVYASAGAKMFFVDVLFDDNTAQIGGAVATNAAGPITFDRCVFTSNEGTVQGGALNFVSANGSIEMRNCIVAQNTSGGHGGGLFIDDSAALPVNLKIYNSTIVENVATYDGGGINMIKGSFEMKDSILFFNQAGAGLTTQLLIYDDGSGPPEVSAAVVQNCAIGGGANPISDAGTRINAPNGFVSGQQGNIIDDPLFVGGTTGGVMRFRLSAASPCIDTGSDGSTVPTYDFLGYSRYNVAGKGDGTGIENDMGAFEYQP